MDAALQQAIVFIDDAHTFGGTQIALAWTVYTVLNRTDIPVLCVCTARTRKAIEEVVGLHSRLFFVEAPRALPLNILSFSLRLFAYFKLIGQIRRHSVRAWWLNLADIEFGLAPLVVLRTYGETTHSYLHGTARFSSFYRHASIPRRVLSWLRDVLAESFAYRLHHLLVTPSMASQIEVRSRLGRDSNRPTGHLYYPPIGKQAELTQAPSVQPQTANMKTIHLWMIGGVVFGHKNNLAALDVLALLVKQGFEVTLTIAGTGPDLGRFQQAAEDGNLSSRITYLGWVSDPCDIAPKDALIFIPSFHETMNIVAREAMRNGLRVVVSPIPVFLEWIPESLIAADFSPEAFCEKLHEVRVMQAKEIAASYSVALARFSSDAFIEEFLRFTRIQP